MCGASSTDYITEPSRLQVTPLWPLVAPQTLQLWLSANMAATLVSFRWLDILEKEFDEAFVDLDILIGTRLCA